MSKYCKIWTFQLNPTTKYHGRTYMSGHVAVWIVHVIAPPKFIGSTNLLFIALWFIILSWTKTFQHLCFTSKQPRNECIYIFAVTLCFPIIFWLPITLWPEHSVLCTTKTELIAHWSVHYSDHLSESSSHMIKHAPIEHIRPPTQAAESHKKIMGIRR